MLTLKGFQLPLFIICLGYAQRFAACRRWRFLALTFIRSTKVYIPTKLSYEALNRHFWQGAVIGRFSLSFIVFHF